MQFQIKTKTGIIKRELKLIKTKDNRYRVLIDETTEIGTVWKADGRIKKFHNHRLDGTKVVDRWFAATVDGIKLGQVFPYDEGFTTRLEALTELLEKVLKLHRDWR